MIYLKQSTASQSVLIGPFVDDTDGATPETALSIANTDIRLSANGGNMVAKNSGGATHDEAGLYSITLDATDTATVGSLQLSVKVTGALYVFHDFQVVEEAIYDSILASGATALATSSALATVDTNVDAILVDTGTTIPATLGTPSDTSIAQDIANDSSMLDTLATSSALATVDANVDAILVDTGTTLPASISALNNISVSDILTTQMTESYASDGTAPTVAQALFNLQQTLGDFSIAGTTITVKKLDGSTTAMTYTLDDATTPTSRTRAT